MTLSIALVIAVAVVAMALFLTEKLPVDVVALLVLVSLPLLGLIEPADALSGFSNEATVTIGAMFILAAGAQNTGALSAISGMLGRIRSHTMFLAVLFAVVVVMSPFVNHVAVVAVFIPVVFAASARIGLAPTKALIPLSYVSQMAGAFTLIGTSTNLIVNSVARQLGHDGFSMFQFAPLAAICTLAGCAFLLLLGRWLLPSERDAELSAIRDTGRYVTELRLAEGAKLAGTTVEEAGLVKEYGVYVLELLRAEENAWAPRSQELQEGDVLLVRGRWPDLERLKHDMGLDYNQEAMKQAAAEHREWLQAASAGHDDGDAKKDAEDGEGNKNAAQADATFQRAFGEKVMAEIMVAPLSMLIGHRLEALNRRLPRHSSVLAVQRRGEVIRKQLEDVRLRVGDILLLLLPEADLGDLRSSNDIILISERGAGPERGWRAAFSLLVIAAVVAVAALSWVPIAIASVAGAVIMLVTGCVRAQEMYDEIDWKVLFVMAGLIPLGVAFSNTGAAELIANHTIGLASELGPYVALAALYLLATLMSETISDTAAAVVLTPIALSTAKLLGVDPMPFLVAVTFSISTSFLTPIGHHSNTMVYSAGGYRFIDFIRIGLPLNAIFCVLGVLLIPVFWPFSA